MERHAREIKRKDDKVREWETVRRNRREGREREKH